MYKLSETGNDRAACESDTETSLYYYRARYYDQNVGRFLSGDPIGFEGGLNYYRYVFNSPALLADPAGLFPTCVSTTSGIACQGDLSPLDLQKSLVQALFPRSVPQGASLILPIPCEDAKKILDNSLSYYTGHFWDGNPSGWDTWNPFLFWDPLFHFGGSEVRSKLGLHFRVKYGKKCDKTCTLDEFHIDEHNPLFDPLGHALNDIPKAIGKGLGIR